METEHAWLHHALGHDRGAIVASFPFREILSATPQDSLYHAEGDVWTHTLMVLDQVEAMQRGDAPGLEGQAMRLAALLHDCAKPETTRIEWCPSEGRERVRQPNHARIGTDKAWRAMIDAGAPVPLARMVCDIIAWHQRPGHIVGGMDRQHEIDGRIMQYGVTGNGWRGLLDFCRCDSRGRISPNVEDSLAALDLVEEAVVDLEERMGVALMDGQALPVTSDEGRVRFGSNFRESIFHRPPDPSGARLIMLSGIPGSGKSTWVRRRVAETGATVISMDAIRDETKRFRMTQEQQGWAWQRAQGLLREALARKEGEVIWDATAISRMSRGKVMRLAQNYGARTAIVSFDIPAHVSWDRNMARDDSRRVPMQAVAAMAQAREYIDAHEAHDLVSVDVEGRETLLLGEPLDADFVQPEP